MKDFFIPEEAITITPEEQLQGVICFTLDQVTEIKEIEVLLTGKSNVHWTEGSGDNQRSYSALDIIIRDYQFPIRKGQSRTLQPGGHQFPFSFNFPVRSQGLPSSYTTANGAITYKVKVKVDRAGKLSDSKYEIPIQVFNPPPLDKPEYQMPGSEQNERTVCCLCCASDPITLNVSVQKVGFVPGETVAFDAYATNPSGRSVVLKAKLMKTVTLRSTGGHTRTTHFTYDKMEGPEVPSNSRHSVRFSGSLTFPSEPLTEYNLIETTNLFVLNVLQIEARISGTPVNLLAPVALTVGVLPGGVQTHPQYGMLPSSTGSNGAPYNQSYVPPSNGYSPPNPGAYGVPPPAPFVSYSSNSGPSDQPPGYEAATGEQVKIGL